MITEAKRERHDKSMEDPTYRGYNQEAWRQAEFLQSILPELDINIKPEGGSWIGHVVYVNYKGYTFRIKEGFDKKLAAWITIRNYPSWIEQKVREDFPKINEATFSKLNTKRLTERLEYEILFHETCTTRAKRTKREADDKFEKMERLLIETAEMTGAKLSNQSIDHIKSLTMWLPFDTYKGYFVKYDTKNLFVERSPQIEEFHAFVKRMRAGQ